MIVFATIAGQPPLHDRSWFAHHPLVLHVWLRDLSPEIIPTPPTSSTTSTTALKADTSPHLAEQLTGHRDFLAGTLNDVMTGQPPAAPPTAPLVFSPFGLGVLDLAVGHHVYDQITRAGGLHTVDGFFHDLSRHG